jgi:hypothetical protein
MEFHFSSTFSGVAGERFEMASKGIGIGREKSE